MATQTALSLLALLSGLLTVTHTVRLWMVVVLAAALSTVNPVDNPTRQTFVPEVVGPQLVRNAVSLNSVMTNAARAIGPALAGILIAAVGVGVCFLANAASFVAVLLALGMIRTDQLLSTPAVARGPGQLVDGGLDSWRPAPRSSRLAPWTIAGNPVSGRVRCAGPRNGAQIAAVRREPDGRAGAVCQQQPVRVPPSALLRFSSARCNGEHRPARAHAQRIAVRNLPDGQRLPHFAPTQLPVEPGRGEDGTGWQRPGHRVCGHRDGHHEPRGLPRRRSVGGVEHPPGRWPAPLEDRPR